MHSEAVHLKDFSDMFGPIILIRKPSHDLGQHITVTVNFVVVHLCSVPGRNEVHAPGVRHEGVPKQTTEPLRQ